MQPTRPRLDGFRGKLSRNGHTYYPKKTNSALSSCFFNKIETKVWKAKKLYNSMAESCNSEKLAHIISSLNFTYNVAS